ncbi:GFA family protein [Rhizobium leguminosarum bv. viciae]|nr:GFA family protein [Rhizobium leguminosarum]MBY5339492.1 GFA family protein [Rhizobium leguminosarum]NKK48396.1 GFA family protein [Rhizobium leguminosarum bv. viciae]TBF83253.1 GFA family protein [Rhizobium leguminosarum]TBF99628.1 GFA family protein [Rhizobium leguminosarum]TBG68813.1 GFA family protein [Rhizobium leguminosarum]
MLTGSCHCSKTGWTLKGDPGSITARRCGVHWAYDYEGERIALSGKNRLLHPLRPGHVVLEILFCPTCARALSGRGLRLQKDGRRRMTVKIRLVPPELVGDLPIDHFDGLESFDDLPSDGRCVRDLWF